MNISLWILLPLEQAIPNDFPRQVASTGRNLNENLQKLSEFGREAAAKLTSKYHSIRDVHHTALAKDISENTVRYQLRKIVKRDRSTSSESLSKFHSDLNFGLTKSRNRNGKEI